ncbi:MAG: TIGR03545 family protein [Pirellulaceae bacterium]|nr:TIGR03545 family protein [Pirellulaceae bacterium]
MIRWSYLLPRLLLLLTVWLGLHFGAGPAARWAFVTAGQSAIGGKVDIDQVHVNLLAGRLDIRQASVADPRSPLRNLVQFDEGVFHLDSQALLHRRLVVEQGALRGIRLDTERSESGALEPREPAEATDWASSQIAVAGREWLEGLGQRLDAKLEDELETVRVGKELWQRWPREYSALEDRVHDWRGRIERLQQIVKQPPRGNVLEQANFYQQQAMTLDQMRKDLVQLHRDLQRLGQQAGQDRQSLDAARRHDEQRIRELVKFDQLDPRNLTEYLLDEETSRRVEDCLAWLQRGQELMNVAGQAPELNQIEGRGAWIDLTTGPQPPDVLIRHLELDGVALWGGQSVAFRGTAEGLTHQPARHGQPAQLHLRTEGAVAATIDCSLDFTTQLPSSRLRIACPQLAQPARNLGRDGQLAVGVAPGAAALQAELELVGRQVSGRVEWHQPDVQLTTQLGSRLGGQRLAQHVQSSVGQIRELRAVVHLEGELPRPRWRLQSDLGSQLATGINAAVRQELAQRAGDLSDQADRLLQEQQARLDDFILGKQAELVEKLNLGEQQLADFQQLVTQRLNLPKELLGRELPLNKLFR